MRDITKEWKDLSALEAKTAVTKSVYLKNATTNHSTEPFDITFIYDPDAPQCSEIKFGEENKVVTELAETITFEYLQKHRDQSKRRF